MGVKTSQPAFKRAGFFIDHQKRLGLPSHMRAVDMASPYLQRQKLPFLEDGFFIDYQALQCYHLSGQGRPQRNPQDLYNPIVNGGIFH